ncbi:hypothetical protein [Micromonospora ureilytica]|uniref:hypothetical protein n=1 Tax=Micromonospora ureilytica TaxID=709868 RepID=UPI002E144EE8
MRRGQIWLIRGARERLGLVISSDVYNSTDTPVVIVAEVVPAALLREEIFPIRFGDYYIMPSRLSSPMRKWLHQVVDVADPITMSRCGRALRILEEI